MSFFSSFLNVDLPITQEYYNLIENILFTFFHNGLTYKEILELQIYLRAAIKTEFLFTEFITPIELMNFYNIAQEIEKAKEKHLEEVKKNK